MPLILKEKSMTVLVTGHTGFKGTWLSILLKRLGHQVIGVSLPPIAESLYALVQQDNFKVDHEIFVDLRSRDEIAKIVASAKPDVVIHLAAQSLVLKSYLHPIETFEVNVLGTANLLDASCRESSVQSILVATTDKVYRNDETGKKFVETDCLSGKDPYSASKVGTESVCSAWQSISSTLSGPQILVARAGNVVGGGDRGEQRLLPDIIRSVQSGTPIKVRNGKATRPWQHVLDPLLGYLKYIDASQVEQVPKHMNFGPTEASKSVEEVLEMARVSMGISYDASEYSNLPIESTFLSLDSQQARKELDWVPRWSQCESINRTFEWWKAYLSGKLTALDCCLRDIEEFLEN